MADLPRVLNQVLWLIHATLSFTTTKLKALVRTHSACVPTHNLFDAKYMPTTSHIHPHTQVWARMHMLHSSLVFSIYLTSFHLSHAHTQGPVHPQPSILSQPISISDTTNKRIPHAYVSLQKIQKYERSSQYYFSKPTSCIEIFTNENYLQEL